MATVDSIWTTKEIVLAIVATGIVTAAASWVVDLVKSKYSQGKAAQYGAMRSAVALERYAVDCWYVFIMGNAEFEQHRSMSRATLPKPLELPVDIDWKALDRRLSDEVLSFQNGSFVQEFLATYSDVWEQNPFDYHDAPKTRGVEALKLAGRIRNLYRMPQPTSLNRVWADFSRAS